MKRKTLPVILILAVLSMAVLVSCGHKHDFSWKSDATLHWQECDCGDTKDEGTHVDENADGVCDACGRQLHVHDYTWQSDADKHWQECDCGDIQNESAHADGNGDGLCDACERIAVTFNMRGHGAAPAVQYVAGGGHAIAPETPDDDDCYKFVGWFEDALGRTEFDFANKTIDAATTVYAVWHEDTTPGASRKYAYALTKQYENKQSVKKGVAVYFSYTAEEEGRYTLYQANGVPSQNSYFTTTLTDGTYGKGQELTQVTFDMDKGQTVYVLFTYDGENETAEAGVLLDEVLNEPLPDYFADGIYYNNLYIFDLDTAQGNESIAGSVTVSGGMEFNQTFRYIGGKFDRVYFTQGDVTYYITRNANGTYRLTNNDDSTSLNATLIYHVEQDPIALASVSGKYVTNGAGGDGITELYIYTSSSDTATTVVYKQSAIWRSYSGSYNTELNMLAFGQYLVTIDMQNDAVVGVSLAGGEISGSVAFTRTGDLGAAPSKTLLPLEENAKYVGTKYTIRDSFGMSQYFGATGTDAIFVLEAHDGKYTVSVNASATYQVMVDNENDTITLYDATGATVLDTLEKFELKKHDLPTVSTNQSLMESDFYENVYVYVVTQAGWYSFTTKSDIDFYYGLNKNFITDMREAQGKITKSIYLAEGTLVGVYLKTPGEVTFTVEPAAAPAGWEENDPMVLKNDTATLENVNNQNTFYFRYTAPQAGEYLISVFYNNGGETAYNLLYTINSVEYGYSSKAWGWVGGLTAEKPYATIVVTEGNLTVDIAVTPNPYAYNVQSITVAILEDYSKDATELTLTGTPAGNSLTVSATAASGANYHLATTKGENVTVTGNAPFTVKLLGGLRAQAEQAGGAYVATIEAGTDLYFTVESATVQNVTLSQTFALGSMGYPRAVTLTNGTATLTVAINEEAPTSYVFFTVAPGVYSMNATVSSYYYEVSFFVNDTQVQAGDAFTVVEGDVLSCIHNDWYDVELTIQEVVYIFTEEQIGSFTGTTTDYYNTPVTVTLTFDRFGIGTYVVKGVGTTNSHNIVIKEKSNGVYTFTYTYEVTFSFDGNKLSVTDDDFGKTYTMEKAAATLDGTYTGTVSNGGDTFDVKLEISGSNVTYSVDIGEWDTSTGTLEEVSEGSYRFTDTYGDTHTFTVSDNTITFTDGYRGATGTLTK